MKKAIFLMIVAVITGLALRAYNLDSPSIGYHSMKENEYLSIAQEMIRTGDFTTQRAYFYNAFEEKDAGILKNNSGMPMIPYHIIASWRLFGENLWGPRLFNAIFGLLSIIVMYYIAQSLFGSLKPAFFSSCILAVVPLGVFFSRNLQPESPAFFFMLLANLFYIKFFRSFKSYAVFLAGLAFSLAWCYKPAFLIGAVPFLLYLPLLRLYEMRGRKATFITAFLLSYAGVLAGVAWLCYTGQWHVRNLMPPSGFSEIFSADYWIRNGRTIWWYADKENFTFIFILLTLVGILIATFRKKGLAERYITGWSLALIPYAAVHSASLYQQNDIQMPFLALVCISSAYAAEFVSQMLKKALKIDAFMILALSIAGLSAPLIYNALLRLHSTVFLGMDVAGESLKGLTGPDERIFLLTHSQGYGIARYARRYMGWPRDLEEFKDKEKRYGVRYLCFYPAEFSNALKTQNPGLFAYIQQNFRVKEVGLKEDPRQILYIILERGAGSDPETFLTSFSGPMQLRTIYRVFGRLIFVYTIRPQT